MASEAVDVARAGMGSALRVRWPDGVEEDYVIVAAEESDPAAGRIAVTSPLAAAVAGHGVGETVTIRSLEPRRVLIVAVGEGDEASVGAAPSGARS
jgi:transcription elongation GreA/GreB family factor